jgi:hypothetical protein
VRVDARNQSAWEGVQLFRRYRAEFADFVEAYAYAADEHALVAGFYATEAGHVTQRSRFVRVETPSLVLRDADGAELWLRGFSCGDIRAHESRDLLVEAGFDPADARAVLAGRVVQLAKGSDPPVVARDSVYPDRFAGYDSYRPQPCLVDDRLAMLMHPCSSADLLARWHDLSGSWVPQPTSAALFADPTAAEAAGFADPSGAAPVYPSPGVWNFFVRDASMREVWMRVGRRQGAGGPSNSRGLWLRRPYLLHRLLLGATRPMSWSRPT